MEEREGRDRHGPNRALGERATLGALVTVVDDRAGTAASGWALVHTKAVEASLPRRLHELGLLKGIGGEPRVPHEGPVGKVALAAPLA